jgi:hypothetical protein
MNNSNRNVEDLAARLDALASDYDPYGYFDSFETSEEGYRQAYDALCGDTSGAEQYLKEIIENEDPGDEYAVEAAGLLKDIQALHEEKRSSVLQQLSQAKEHLPHTSPGKDREEVL